MERSPLIQCNQLAASISSPANSDINLDLATSSASIVSIIGPDFRGKTAWLKIIGGIEEPASGELYLLGKNVDDFTYADWVEARKKIAYLPLEPSLLSAASVLQNTMLPALYHDMYTANEAKEQAMVLLDQLAADCDINILPAYLRKDQRFRVALARALILRPKVMLLDNPFSLMDIEAANSLKQFLINRVKQDNLLLILITHDIKFALKHSDQILFIGENQIYNLNGNEIGSCSISEINDYLSRAM